MATMDTPIATAPDCRLFPFMLVTSCLAKPVRRKTRHSDSGRALIGYCITL